MTTAIETKKCKCCGQELPLSEFTTTQFGILHTCKACVVKNRVEAIKQKKEAVDLQASVEDAKKARLGDFTPRELLAELKRRGYKWDKMWVETVQYVEYNKI